MTGITAYNMLASKFLQVNPNGTVPVAPPTAAFVGDSLAITAASGLGSITFASNAASSPNVKVELLVQPPKGKNRKPGTRRYVSKGFVAFAAGSLTSMVGALSGYYACTYRYVSTTTGQATALTPITTVTIALSVEDGDLGEETSQAA